MQQPRALLQLLQRVRKQVHVDRLPQLRERLGRRVVLHAAGAMSTGGGDTGVWVTRCEGRAQCAGGDYAKQITNVG